ncbi:hypothetical protein Pelo_16448 [Pelomyxa schiedti]|nr:hypothetical protein Pelo_16448 [Pelomyxa schiedti]
MMWQNNGVSSLQQQQMGQNPLSLVDQDGRIWELLSKTGFPMHYANRQYTRVRCVNYDKCYFTQALIGDFLGSPDTSHLNTHNVFPEMLTITPTSHPRDYQTLIELGVYPPDTDVILLSTLEGLRAKVTEMIQPQNNLAQIHPNNAPNTPVSNLAPSTFTPSATTPLPLPPTPALTGPQTQPCIMRSPMAQPQQLGVTPQQIIQFIQQRQSQQRQLEQLQPLVPQTLQMGQPQPQPQQPPQQQIPNSGFENSSSTDKSPKRRKIDIPPAINIAQHPIPKMTWAEVIHQTNQLEALLQQLRGVASTLHMELQQLAATTVQNLNTPSTPALTSTTPAAATTATQIQQQSANHNNILLALNSMSGMALPQSNNTISNNNNPMLSDIGSSVTRDTSNDDFQQLWSV